MFALPRLSSVVKQLIIGLSVAYVPQLVLEKWLDFPIVTCLRDDAGRVLPWQLVTYVSVDLNQPPWFLLGLLFIWWALSPFEIGYGGQAHAAALPRQPRSPRAFRRTCSAW